MSTVFIAGAVMVFSRNLPEPTKLSHRDIAQSTKIYDRNGVLLYEVYHNENRTLVPLKELPKQVIQATLAAEDAHFYEHDGIDLRGVLFAAYETLIAGKVQGGSTITQQLVKNSLLSNQQTLDRKAREALLALQIERRYSKDEILQMYLNDVPYGGQVYGIQAAARTYFNVDAQKLSIAQTALLAGLTQSPTAYSPFVHRQAALERQKYVLHLMHKAGFISQVQEDAAKQEELAFASPQVVIKAPWFTLYVKQQLIKQYGEKMVEEGGLRVTTTLDLAKQEIAEQEIRYQLDRLAQVDARASQGAALTLPCPARSK